MHFSITTLKHDLIALGLISICIALPKPTLYASTLTLQKKNILINQKQVSLQSNIIHDNGVTYLPLRDITKHLQNKLTFNKLDYQHEWQLADNILVSFSRFQPKYKFNNQSVYWKHRLKYEFFCI